MYVQMHCLIQGSGEGDGASTQRQMWRRIFWLMNMKRNWSTVVDPGFLQGGGRLLSMGAGGAPTYDFAQFSQKLHEFERIRTPRGVRVPRAP